jgi:hypothetical protein
VEHPPRLTSVGLVFSTRLTQMPLEATDNEPDWLVQWEKVTVGKELGKGEKVTV